MSDDYKDWREKRENDAFNAICRIAEIYEDYHYTSDIVLEKIGEILRKYEFVD